ncbi:hypothetical protein TELCIR_13027 [Teladorsagia circumcincta]|uniref:Uncharacterized protein n=1 Tax=Teladorsagia circumcincta TaxID=45464 RepID=A0A2G9U4V5_TELCI|nr:hypothetical protein TELCIR_13027 [Teladorsagia circumcincta]
MKNAQKIHDKGGTVVPSDINIDDLRYIEELQKKVFCRLCAAQRATKQCSCMIQHKVVITFRRAFTPKSTMFERFLSVFIFILYLFDTVFASTEKDNGGKDRPRKLRALNRPVAMEKFAMPS